jgi:hypothetical protein
MPPPESCSVLPLRTFVVPLLSKAAPAANRVVPVAAVFSNAPEF